MMGVPHNGNLKQPFGLFLKALGQGSWLGQSRAEGTRLLEVSA